MIPADADLPTHLGLHHHGEEAEVGIMKQKGRNTPISIFLCLICQIPFVSMLFSDKTLRKVWMYSFLLKQAPEEKLGVLALTCFVCFFVNSINAFSL